jgi:hypothetical protein
VVKPTDTGPAAGRPQSIDLPEQVAEEEEMVLVGIAESLMDVTSAAQAASPPPSPAPPKVAPPLGK